MVGMVDYALNYQANGFSVIPIDKRSKRAITKFKDSTFNADDIKRFWHEEPEANIALRTVDFFVIDIDITKTENGYQSLNDWELSHYIPDTLRVTTPSGGEHIYLKKPQGIEISQDIRIKAGIDIKANKNNYILVPPSNNSKGQYKWKNKHPIAECPPEILEILKTEKKKSKVNFTTDYQKGEYSSKTAKLFEQVVYGLGDKGGRNNALASFIGGLLLRGVEVDAIYMLAKLANHYTPESLPQSELDRTFESMLRKDMDGS